jgi:hypothetical protein
MLRAVLFLVAIWPSLALAQVPPARVDDTGRPLDGDALGLPDPNGVRPANYTVPGQAEAVGRALLGRMVAATKGELACKRSGCLVLVNDNRDYRLTGFFVASGAVGEGRARQWSRNRLSGVLPPLMAVAMPKTGGPESCAVPVRFTLRHRRTSETLAVEGTADMCRRPMIDSVIRLHVTRPSVSAESTGPDRP